MDDSKERTTEGRWEKGKWDDRKAGNNTCRGMGLQTFGGLLILASGLLTLAGGMGTTIQWPSDTCSGYKHSVGF